MAHNTRARVSWANGGIPTESEWTKLDDNAFKSVNGDEGGVWTPSAPIVIGAAGVQLALASGGSRFASVAALKAIVGAGDGQFAVVPGIGAYTFDASMVLGENLPWIVQPTVGTGRWVHELANMRLIPGGFAMVETSTGNLAAIHVERGIVGMYESELTTAFATNASTMVAVGALAIPIPLAIEGDVLDIDCVMACWTNSGSNQVGEYEVRVFQGAMTAAWGGKFEDMNATVHRFANVHARFTCPGIGAVSISPTVQQNNGPGGNFTVLGPLGDRVQSTIRVTHYRP